MINSPYTPLTIVISLYIDLNIIVKLIGITKLPGSKSLLPKHFTQTELSSDVEFNQYKKHILYFDI